MLRVIESKDYLYLGKKPVVETWVLKCGHMWTPKEGMALCNYRGDSVCAKG